MGVRGPGAKPNKKVETNPNPGGRGKYTSIEKRAMRLRAAVQEERDARLQRINGAPVHRRRRRGVYNPSEPRQPWQTPGRNRAAKVIAFIESLVITSGELEGQKLSLRPWQRQFIEAVYATDNEGRRLVRTAVLSMGRKNGKTQLAAALALCHLSGPEAEERGEVYACANDRFQASKLFNEMYAMLRANDYLRDRSNVYRARKDIEDLDNHSVFYTLTSEAKTKMGLSPSFVVYDELGQSNSRELYDTMDSAMGARKEPLLLVISTQAATSAAPFSQLIDYGIKVKAGDIKDPSFHLTLYTAPDEADPWDVKTWHMANPALGDFRSMEDVRRMALQGQRIPAQENAFRNLILNQRIAAEARFIEPSAWKACVATPAINPGMIVYGGLDLGSTRDMSALVLAAQDPVSGEVSVVPYVWVPGDLNARTNEDGAPYAAWAKEGIVFEAGMTTDPRVIARKIAELHGKHKIRGIAFDRWRMEELKRELDAIGCNVPLVEHGQGYKDMSTAVDVVERLLVGKKLRHGGHPALTWCANNAVVTRDPAGNRKFDKSISQYQARIDALVAMAMACNLALVKKPPAPLDLSTLIA